MAKNEPGLKIPMKRHNRHNRIRTDEVSHREYRIGVVLWWIIYIFRGVAGNDTFQPEEMFA